MSITSKEFGKTKDGKTVTMYTLENSNGLKASFLDLGAVMVNLFVPDRNGKLEDIVLGYDTAAEYEVNGPSFGAPVGRVANRISGASVVINGTTYNLDKNNGENCLHTGYTRLNHFMYEAECLEEDGEHAVVFSRVSEHLEQGLPGNLDMSITYRLTDDNALYIEYYGVSDQDTLIALTNHTYFNLGPGGHKGANVLEHKVMIDASRFTPTGDDLIPTGEFLDIAGTPMDFREFKALGADIHADYKPLKQGNGYDHNFVLNHPEGEVSLAAVAIEEKSGRKMEVFTDLPGLQLYTANTLVEPGKDGTTYREYGGVCFETQYFPNAYNTPGFQDNLFKAGEEYSNVTVFQFSVI